MLGALSISHCVIGHPYYLCSVLTDALGEVGTCLLFQFVWFTKINGQERMLCLARVCEKLTTSCGNLVPPGKSRSAKQLENTVGLTAVRIVLAKFTREQSGCRASMQPPTPQSAIAEDYASLMEVRNPFSGEEKVHSALSE